MIFGSDILRIVTVYSEHTFVCFWTCTPDSDFALRLSYIIYNKKNVYALSKYDKYKIINNFCFS